MIPAITPVTAIASASPASAAPAASTATTGSDNFADILGSALNSLGGTTANADTLAMEGATGQANVADVTVAGTEAQLAVQLATTTRDDAVTAFNSIMSMTAG